jgi:hypothetical protein
MRRPNWPPKAAIRATLTSIPKKWRSCLLHSDVVSAIVVEGDGLFRSQADKAVTAAMQKIDRSTSIVAETEQFGERRNSCLKSRARLSDGSERRFLVCAEKICAGKSAR